MLIDMDRPRPMLWPPPFSLVVKNGSNMLSMTSGVMPGPVSLNSATAYFPAPSSTVQVDMKRVPEPAIASLAFFNMLRTTSIICPLFPKTLGRAGSKHSEISIDFVFISDVNMVRVARMHSFRYMGANPSLDGFE